MGKVVKGGSMDNTLKTAAVAKSDALALEYKGMYGGASRNINVSDFVNDPRASGVCRVFGLRLSEKPLNLIASDLRSFLDNGTDSQLVTEDTVKALT